ncbi:hypothetical protein ACHAWF_011293 [Thalassiosira exigua]
MTKKPPQPQRRRRRFRLGVVALSVLIAAASPRHLLAPCHALRRSPPSTAGGDRVRRRSPPPSRPLAYDASDADHRRRSASIGDGRLLPRGGGVVRPSSAPPPASPSQSRRRGLVVALVAAALFNDMLQLTMLLPIIHTLVSSPPPLGVAANREVALGLFFASKDLCQMAAAPVAGWIASRTSAQAALIASTAGLGLATFVFAEATTFRQLMLARGAQGAASAAVLCGGMTLIAETHPPDARGSAMGLAQTGLALGLLCGPLVGGLLFRKFGRKETFRLAAGMVLANALAMLTLMGLAPPERSTEKVQEVDDGTKESLAEAWRRLLANRDILAVTASTFAIHAVIGVIKPISQVVLDTEFGIDMVGRSFVISIATVAYFVAAPVSGYLSDHISHPRMVAFGLALMAASAGCFAMRGLGIWAFYICVGLLGVGMGVQKCGSQSLLADLVDRHDLGEYSMVYALSDVADSMGLIVGPVLGLWLAQMFTNSIGVLAVGLPCLLLVPIVLGI